MIGNPHVQEFVDDGFRTEAGWLAEQAKIEGDAAFGGTACPFAFHGRQPHFARANSNAAGPYLDLRPKHGAADRVFEGRRKERTVFVALHAVGSFPTMVMMRSTISDTSAIPAFTSAL
jgi:hypothetical protein